MAGAYGAAGTAMGDPLWYTYNIASSLVIVQYNC